MTRVFVGLIGGQDNITGQSTTRVGKLPREAALSLANGLSLSVVAHCCVGQESARRGRQNGRVRLGADTRQTETGLCVNTFPGAKSNYPQGTLDVRKWHGPCA